MRDNAKQEVLYFYEMLLSQLHYDGFFFWRQQRIGPHDIMCSVHNGDEALLPVVLQVSPSEAIRD
mgnify:FL=1